MLVQLLFIAGKFHIEKLQIFNINQFHFISSAGIGRSGTFCLVDCCLVLFENEDVVDVSVKDVLLELRKGRMGLIQTSDQLSFSYEAIIEGIERMEKHVNFELFLKLKIFTNFSCFLCRHLMN